MKRMREYVMCICAVTLAGCALVGCGGEEAKTDAQPRNVRRVTAYIDPKSDTDTLGTAIFINEGESIALQVNLETSPAGTHRVQIHEVGDCSADDASSAGGPWGAPQLHEIGEIEIGKDGKGELTFASNRWSMGSGESSDILGKAVVIVSNGRRIGCGVIPES